MFSKTLLAFTAFISLVGVCKSHGTFNGDATYYYTGLGNCGAWSRDNDYIVALSTREYNRGTQCWKHIRVHYQGKTINATVVDSCPSCSQYSIDLSPSAFNALADSRLGRIQVTWEYAN